MFTNDKKQNKINVSGDFFMNMVNKTDTEFLPFACFTLYETICNFFTVIFSNTMMRSSICIKLYLLKLCENFVWLLIVSVILVNITRLYSWYTRNFRMQKKFEMLIRSQVNYELKCGPVSSDQQQREQREVKCLVWLEEIYFQSYYFSPNRIVIRIGNTSRPNNYNFAFSFH